MIALIFSTFCMFASIFEAYNAKDIAAIILMASSMIWYILYLIALSMSNRTSLMRTFFNNKGGSEE